LARENGTEESAGVRLPRDHDDTRERRRLGPRARAAPPVAGPAPAGRTEELRELNDDLRPGARPGGRGRRLPRAARGSLHARAAPARAPGSKAWRIASTTSTTPCST